MTLEALRDKLDKLNLFHGDEKRHVRIAAATTKLSCFATTSKRERTVSLLQRTEQAPIARWDLSKTGAKIRLLGS